MAPFLRFLRPQSFLHLIPLRTATEFIAFTLAINKVTGLYGILALFTGYHLNALQLSHYIYSLVVLILVAYLSPAVRQAQDAPAVLKVLGLAWLYVLDAAVNAAYTALFGLGWFVLLAQHLGQDAPVMNTPGAAMMNDTAGFTSPSHTVSEVTVAPTPVAAGIVGARSAAAYVSREEPGAAAAAPGGVFLQPGSMASVSVLALLWSIRVYFCLIVLSYARSTLRQYIARSSAATATYTSPADPNLADSPFRAGAVDGAGWRGRLGRIMLMFPTRGYWLGRDEREDDWVRTVEGRLGSGKGLRIKVPEEGGVWERERRARSGTGPPLPVGVKGKVPM